MWNYEDNEKLLYFVSNNFAYNPNIAIFSLSNTLIQDTISKDKINFMQISNILPCLHKINENGSIVIIENGIRVGKENLKLITKKFFDLIDNEANHIPFIILFPLANNKFQKPFTQIFTKLQILYSTKNKTIINEKSVVVGNAAGRVRTAVSGQDASDHDRAFASNITMQFKTPEQFFNSETAPRQWAWRNNIIEKLIAEQKILLEPKFENIFNNIAPKYVILLSGPPTSGKTLLGNRIKQHLQNIVFDINTYTNMEQMLPFIQKSISNHDNIIIIDTMESTKKRSSYFDLVPVDYKIYYIEIDASSILCEFLNMFKAQISKNNQDLYPKYIYYNYYKYYRSLELAHKKKLELYIKFPLILRIRKELFFHY